MLFCYIKLFKPYANYFYDKIQDVFSLVSIDEFTSAMRGYKNSLDERFLRELSVPDQIGKNHKKKFNRICQLQVFSKASCSGNRIKIMSSYTLEFYRGK